MESRFVVGVDLGTTNSVVGYAPLEGEQCVVQVLSIPQLVAAGTIESRQQLPSFLYLGLAAERDSRSLDLPWSDGESFAVGELARSQAAATAERTVVAAKSWLCHSRVDRHQEILPWGASGDIEKVSPVTATARYLSHIKNAWELQFPDAPLAEQLVVLTVPASFDASARELTHEAAREAGFPEQMVLLEEPQAAVYHWLEDEGDAWRKSVTAGDCLLVCDVGGGTTDLSLIHVVDEGGDLGLRRQAVGKHLLVGGDNMDLALAHHVSGLFAEQGHQLDPWQSVSLWHACRAAKEILLAPHGPDSCPVSVLGRGRKLIGNTITVQLARELVSSLLVDGFFPICPPDAIPQVQQLSGFQQIGLPFEADTAVTRHLAAFLGRHAVGDDPRPNRLLFNGGVFKSAVFQQRVVETLGQWYDNQQPVILPGGADLDQAVARGATYYGWSKSRGGLRIRGGTARSYYVGVETSGPAIPGAARPLQALCVVPFGMEEGDQREVPSAEIGLVVGQPATFRFFSSTTRQKDTVGQTLAGWSSDELQETDSLEATLDEVEDIEGPYVPVHFESRVTELGMFELWCAAARTDHRWKLEFSIRADAQTDPVEKTPVEESGKTGGTVAEPAP